MNSSNGIVLNQGNLSDSSSAEAEEYVNLCQRLTSINFITERTLDTSFIVSGLIGFVCHILSIFVHRHMPFFSSTLISYQSMTVIELFHMVIMAQSGIMRWIRIRMGDRFYETRMTIWLFQFNEGWHMGDAAKLTISTISTFISLERMMAVCFPLFVNRIKHNWCAYLGVFVSLIIGSAHLWPMLALRVEYDPETGKYKTVDTDFQTSIFYLFLPNFIFGAKILLSLTIFVSSVAMIIKLRYESKKQMLLNVTAKSDWVARRRLCMFTFILGISILCDHVVWVIFKFMIGLITVIGLSCDVSQPRETTFKEATRGILIGQSVTWLYFAQGFTGELVHCYRFFIHFAFNRAMRDGFWKAMGKGKDKVVGVGNVKATKS